MSVPTPSFLSALNASPMSRAESEYVKSGSRYAGIQKMFG